MKIELDRAKKIVLLRWLQNGVIDTADLPELADEPRTLTAEQAAALMSEYDKIYKGGTAADPRHVCQSSNKAKTDY